MYDDNYLNETIRITFGDEKYYFVPNGITRFDYSHTHGWWVRIRRDAVPFSLMFSDGPNGGINEALLAAIKYRHDILVAFPLSERKANFRTISDVPEERITRIDEMGRKQRYIAWKAKWYDENHKIQSKNFSVMKFGEDKARELALTVTIKNHNNIPRNSKLVRPYDPYGKLTFNKVLREDVEVLASVDSKPTRRSVKIDAIIAKDPFSFEGEKNLQIHQTIERDSKLRSQKIAVFFSEHGNIFCEICGFNFKKNYPFLLKDIIEVHHIVPLSKVKKGTETRLADLLLVCSNCHFVLHQGDAEKNILSAIDHF